MRACLLCAALLIVSCASRTTVPDPAPLFRDTAFAPPATPIDPGAVFALTPEMRRYLREDVVGRSTERDLRRVLLDALYDQQLLRLEYDARGTRNAAEAFEARSGNCLSLVIMTAALARELGLQVRFQTVQTAETWSRTDDLMLASGHVNLSLSNRRDPTWQYLSPEPILTVDFLPPESLRRQRTLPIGEHRVLAMYMNNRAAESLAAQQTDEAYWWSRAALGQDHRFVPAWNTLGVIYLRRGLAGDAERAFRAALAQEPQQVQALANLAQTLEQRGETGEARALRDRLAQLESQPPFHDYDRGLIALREGRLREAQTLFGQELRRAGHNPEFHFAYAVTSLQLGDRRLAERHLKLALDNSQGGEPQHALYAAKLERLREQAHP